MSREKNSDSMKAIRLNDCKICMIGVIKGLVDEEEKVRKVYYDMMPDVVAISISIGELKGLEDFLKQRYDVPLSNYEEEIYIRELKKYGEVRKPPPCFEESLKLCQKDNLPIVPIDMDEERFSTAYCEYITSFQLIRNSFRRKRLHKRKFHASSAEKFVKEWDRVINDIKGFRMLEEERERYMAQKLSELTKQYKKILAFIELERVKGVEKKLIKR